MVLTVWATVTLVIDRSAVSTRCRRDRALARALADRLAVIGEDLDLVDVVEGDLADVLGIGQVLVGRPIVVDRGEGVGW